MSAKLLLTRCLIALSSLVLAQAATAAGNSGKNLYNIDILVFADDRPDSPSSELWRNDINLRYPPELIELIAERSFDAAGDASRGSLLIKNLGDPDLLAAYRKMRSSRYYRPLFTGSWQQSLVDSDSAPSLLITGGKRYGRYHELSGSIKISLDRYLHINSDLWLSQFQPANALIDMTDWPSLPLPFETAPDDESEGLPPYSPVVWRSNDWFNRYAYGRLSQTTMVSPAWMPGGQPYYGSAKLDRASSSEGRGRATFSRLRQATSAMDNDSPWRLQRTVELKQHRKMRSREIHYLDHPMFGLMIKITPVKQTTAAVTTSG